METFYTLHDFLVYTKGAAYILMGVILLGVLGFWLFITGRDEETYIK
ncbi:MAG: sulfate respiration complex protein HmcD [Desulfobaccales bacterium]